MTSSTNGRGQTTSYSYDAAGRLVREDTPEGYVSQILDANGNPVVSDSKYLEPCSRTFHALDASYSNP